MGELSHLDEKGRAKMVDIGAKMVTERKAVASASVLLNKETLALIKTGTNPKGDPFEVARIAGITAAKRTSDLIPLCHQIPLTSVDVSIELTEKGAILEATAATGAKTGVEMEALTAVSVAALTIYDMCKAVQKDIEISDIRLESKTGGKTDYQRE